MAAGIGLVLGVVGLYGAVSDIASQRTVEIGVRLALGARPGSVCIMVLRQGTSVALIGIVVGLAAAWSSARFMSSMLFEVSAHDPTYATMALVLMAVSIFATYVPARKAAALDPVQALPQRRLNPRRVGRPLVPLSVPRPKSDLESGPPVAVITRIGGDNGAETVERRRLRRNPESARRRVVNRSGLSG